MLDQCRSAAQSEQSREQLFTERYEILLEWALQLTNRQDAAEDLVQDAFVQFMLARTQLEEIENIDGYLRRLLHNMHVSRMHRLSQRLRDDALSIVDYDTLRVFWAAVETPRRMQVAEELHQICAYACLRKETSRAGSVLILRFFLDYLPTEIASVLSSSRHCVDQWQRLARREVKLFMEEPDRLRFVGAGTAQARPLSDYPGSDCDLMLALRALIFGSCQGSCLPKDQLAAAYAKQSGEALSTTDLAHIVSCRSCLDAVNAILGLPLLAQRYPAEDCHGDEPPREGGGAGGSGDVPTLPKRFKRQLREIREHKPSELRISVNGVLRSSLIINGESSEIDLNLPLEEQPEFVEVTSEQGVQLLFLSINDNSVNYEQWAEIELSERRALVVTLRMSGGPRLHVLYNDPVVPEISPETTTKKVLSSLLTVVPARTVVESSYLKGHLKALLAALRNALRRDRIAKDTEVSAAAPTSLGLLGQPQSISQRRFWSSPALLTFLFLIVVGAASLVYRATLEKTPAATDLLAQATIAELDRARVSDRVGHRSINLEIRRSSEGALISRHTIESWENYEQPQRIQRLYDESGRLLAAATQDAGGTRTVYHHQSKTPQQRGSTPESLLLDLDDIWQLIPSVREFDSIIAEPAAAVVQQRATSYVVTIEKERAIGASRLIKATLTLSKDDLHAVEQTLVVQRGAELREYKFVETASELLPSRAVGPNVFQIDPELAGEIRTSKGAAAPPITKNTADPTPTTSNPSVASAELEIDVAYLLNQAKADRNEQVTLTRSASGSLRVEGILESNERREEFLRVLRPVANNPAVIIQLRTVSEATTQAAPQGKQSIREIEDTVNTIAVDQELRDYFSRRGLTGEALDQSVRSYSSRVVNHSYQALFHAIELRRLALRFAHVDMRTVAPDARTKWLAMVRERALAFNRETVALRRELQPIFLSDASSTTLEDFTTDNDAELTRAIERLHRMALANSQAISQAFTISAESSAVAFKSQQFSRSLEGAVTLSNRISQVR
ncbi:MAG TPA: RNA polymerase sigma factor [Pyrinomonadaceae bacterium]|nr:RNA polymerase sigma factor [Pyrinomonadaceae bacterium]